MFVTSQVSMPAAIGFIPVNKPVIQENIKTYQCHALCNKVTHKVQVNNLVLSSWYGELPLCWCQAIQCVLKSFLPSPGLAARLWLAWLSGSSGLHTPTVLCSYFLQVVYA